MSRSSEAHRTSEHEAIALLGVPRHHGITTNLAELDAALDRTGRQSEFRSAMLAVAQDIEDDPARRDHAAVRRALDGWTIPDGDRDRLVAVLKAKQYQSRQADWGDRRRLCATAIVWELATGGEMDYAPVLQHGSLTASAARSGVPQQLPHPPLPKPSRRIPACPR